MLRNMRACVGLDVNLGVKLRVKLGVNLGVTGWTCVSVEALADF